MTSKLKDFANILGSEIKCLYGARDSLSSLSELIIIFESPRTAIEYTHMLEYTNERVFKCV